MRKLIEGIIEESGALDGVNKDMLLEQLARDLKSLRKTIDAGIVAAEAGNPNGAIGSVANAVDAIGRMVGKRLPAKHIVKSLDRARKDIEGLL